MSGFAHLVLGGARSGKTRYALGAAAATGFACVYVATGTAGDAEMAERIARHRAERGDGWTTLECPVALAEAIAIEARPDRVLLVDCLTLWISNQMFAEAGLEADIEAATAGLVAALGKARGPVILVSNEVGLGIVPDNALARRFRDHQGRVNQSVAEIAERVTFVAAGLPLRLKG